MTSPVLVVALVALAVGFATFRSAGEGGGTSASPARTPGSGGVAPSELQGVWTGPGETVDGVVTVRLTIRPGGGRLRRGDCRGTLEMLGIPGRDRAAFGYTERSRRQSCPQESRVTVFLEDGELRLTETIEGAPYLSAVLTRATTGSPSPQP